MTGSGCSLGLVVFSHGKDSGPGATKISALRPLAAEQGSTLRLAAHGDDAGDAVEALADLVGRGFEAN